MVALSQNYMVKALSNNQTLRKRLITCLKRANI